MIDMVEEKSWGYYMVLEEGSSYKIKRVYVAPNQKLSLQMHYHRSEHWIVVKGMALVNIGEEEFFLRSGESTFVECGLPHRLSNPGVIPLEVIEVEIGQYLKEDDVVRIDDPFNLYQCAQSPEEENKNA
jgi:mannose-1-phosphate guanylyltransferase/mannose-6-phosphate isomerase